MRRPSQSPWRRYWEAAVQDQCDDAPWTRTRAQRRAGRHVALGTGRDRPAPPSPAPPREAAVAASLASARAPRGRASPAWARFTVPRIILASWILPVGPLRRSASCTPGGA